MIREWLRLYHARNWMNRNKSFLPTWHAYIGYSMELFDLLAKSGHVEQIALQEKISLKYLTAWVEVGLILGHLKRTSDGKIVPSRYMMTYIAGSSEYSVGALLKEMMELHIPSLLHYPQMLRNESTLIYQDENYGATVAETSSYLEKLAIPKLNAWVRKQKPNSILDIGCGHAGYLIHLAKKFPNVKYTGIEKNKLVFDQALQNVRRANTDKINIFHADIDDWRSEKHSTDLIMLNNILYYFSSSQRKKLFERLHELLNEQGAISMISPIHPTRDGKSFSSAFNIFMTSHENLYALPSEEELHQLAHQSGFRFHSMNPIVKEGSWYFITWVKA